VINKEIEKVEKYQDLLLEIQRFWNVKAEIIPIVMGALGALSSKFKDWLKRLNIKLYPSVSQKSIEDCWLSVLNTKHSSLNLC